MKDSIDPIQTGVKLVIWDLDETFWKGTLSEGGISPIQDNIDMVRALVNRGIMCSICSKNDFADAKSKLEELGIFDQFVFPFIDWTPKGQAIKSMIAAMGLRAENVIFLDDNHMNLQEAAFFNDTIMCIDGAQDLRWLLDHPHLQGKDDTTHSRLKQYQILQDKTAEQDSKGLSNVEFLRQSDVRVSIVTDFDDKMDRVFELINRTNQLNFTKSRLTTDEERAHFVAELQRPGVHAGLIHAKDRFGDYGYIGFFQYVLRSGQTRLEHFAFSCRTLNMGIEQFIFEFLGEPDIKIVGPVANEIKSFDDMDWVSFGDDSDLGVTESTESVCLVGGCDLLQASFYLGAKRSEFVNFVKDGSVVRYDDPGFFLNPREAMKNNTLLESILSWTYDDMVAFDDSMAQSDRLVISLYQAMAGQNYFTFGGREFGGEHLIHLPPQALKAILAGPRSILFAKRFFHRNYSLDDKSALIKRALERVRDTKKPGAAAYLISAGTLNPETARSMPFREPYNELCRAFCQENPEFTYLDVDRLIDAQHHVDAQHFSRLGYFAMAEFIQSRN